MKTPPGIYTPLGLDRYELCRPVRKEDFERISVEVSGAPRRDDWTPIPMQLIREDEGKKLAPSDCPWFGAHALVFRARGVEALGPLLQEHGELLPLECSEADLVMYNPTRVLDALDQTASSVLRFGDGRIMMIQRHVFRAEALAGVDVFKLANLDVSPTFVSERFVDRFQAS